MAIIKLLLPFILGKKKLTKEQEEMRKGYINFRLHLATSTASTYPRLFPLKFGNMMQCQQKGKGKKNSSDNI